MDSRISDVSRCFLPQSFSNCENVFNMQQPQPETPHTGLLKELQILGARLDIEAVRSTRTFLVSSCAPGVHLVEICTDGRTNTPKMRISGEENEMLVAYCGGVQKPDEADPFPEPLWSPDLDGSAGDQHEPA